MPWPEQSEQFPWNTKVVKVVKAAGDWLLNAVAKRARPMRRILMPDVTGDSFRH